MQLWGYSKTSIVSLIIFVWSDSQYFLKLLKNMANTFLSWWFCACIALSAISQHFPFLDIYLKCSSSEEPFLILPIRDYHFFLWFLHDIYLYLTDYINLTQQCIIFSIVLNYMLSVFFLFFLFFMVLFITLKTKISVIDGSHPLLEGTQHF